MNLNKWAMRTTKPFLAMMVVLSVALLLTLPAAASDFTLGGDQQTIKK